MYRLAIVNASGPIEQMTEARAPALRHIFGASQAQGALSLIRISAAGLCVLNGDPYDPHRDRHH